MPSNIDVSKPTSTMAYTADVRQNFRHTRDEINELDNELNVLDRKIDDFEDDYLTKDDADATYLRRDVSTIPGFMWAEQGFRVGNGTNYTATIEPNLFALGSSSALTAQITLQATNTARKSVKWISQGGADRWELVASGQELGSSQGSNFVLERTMDDGLKYNSLRIERNTGIMRLGDGLVSVESQTRPNSVVAFVGDQQRWGFWSDTFGNNLHIGTVSADLAPLSARITLSTDDLRFNMRVVYNQAVNFSAGIQMDNGSRLMLWTDPLVDNEAATKHYVDGQLTEGSFATKDYVDATFLDKTTGGVVADQISMALEPIADEHLANKKYVDDKIGDVDFADYATLEYLAEQIDGTKVYTDAEVAALRQIVIDADYLTAGSGDVRYFTKTQSDDRYLRPDVGGFITKPIQLLFAPAITNDAVHKGYVDGAITNAVQGLDTTFLKKDGSNSFTGVLDFEGDSLGLRWPRGAIAYEINTGLRFRRSTGQDKLFTEDNNGANPHALLDARDARANSALHNLTQNYTLPAGGAWIMIWSGAYPIPRGGNSRISISIMLHTELPTANIIALIGVRLQGLSNIERHGFIYRMNEINSDYVVTLVYDMIGANQGFAIQAANLATSTPLDITIRGGDDAVDNRSQILFTDLGPR